MPEVAEAAAVPVIDDIRGRMVEMYVSLKPGVDSDGMEAKVVTAIETEIGKIARPKNVWIVPDMPKTRSGKIMRRVIASVSNFADVGDVTTLANPEVVDGIRHQVQQAKVAKGDTPRRAIGYRAGRDPGLRQRVAPRSAATRPPGSRAAASLSAGSFRRPSRRPGWPLPGRLLCFPSFLVVIPS